MAQWLWPLQSDTLGSSPAVAVFSLFSFLPEQVEFQKTSIDLQLMDIHIFCDRR